MFKRWQEVYSSPPFKKRRCKMKEVLIKYKIENIKENLTLIHFELPRELEPQDLKKIKPPDPVENKFSENILILSGRGPIWLYGFLIHFYHPVKAIAIFDPRLNGAVVIESHTKEIEVGDLIKIE
jgi:CRISPR-associated protein Csx3